MPTATPPPWPWAWRAAPGRRRAPGHRSSRLRRRCRHGTARCSARIAARLFAVLEWRDGKLTFVSPDQPTWKPTLLATGDEDTFVVEPGYRQSGETATFERLPDGRVLSVYLTAFTLRRQDDVTAEGSTRSKAASPRGTTRRTAKRPRRRELPLKKE